MLKKLRTSKGDYCIKWWFSKIMSLFKMELLLKKRGSKFFPLRAVPCGMENHFYHINWAPLSVTIFIHTMNPNCTNKMAQINIDTLSSAISTGSTPFGHDWKIVHWDVRNQNKQTNNNPYTANLFCLENVVCFLHLLHAFKTNFIM